jgi:hypothetical protein
MNVPTHETPSGGLRRFAPSRKANPILRERWRPRSAPALWGLGLGPDIVWSAW